MTDDLASVRNECIALVSSVADVNENYSDHVNDGDPQTWWRSWPNDRGPQWLELRWEYPVQLDQLWLRTARVGMPTRFTVERWEHEQWVKVRTFDGLDLDDDGCLRAKFDTITTERLRINFEAFTGHNVRLAEVETYGPPQVLLSRVMPYWKAHYIWYPEPSKTIKVEPRYFRKSFTVENFAAVDGAFLQMRSNDQYIAFINGQEVARGSTMIRPNSVRAALRQGANVIAVQANPAKDPGWPLMTMLAELTINSSTGTQTIASGNDWLCSNTDGKGWNTVEFNDKNWAPAMICATPPDQPWGRIPYFDVGPREHVTVGGVTITPAFPEPGQDVRIDIDLQPTAKLRQDYLFQVIAGEPEINPERSNYVVAKALVEPTVPATKWEPGKWSRVSAVLTLPSYAPVGRTPVRMAAIGLNGTGGLDIAHAGEGCVIAQLEIRREGFDIKPQTGPPGAVIVHENGVSKIIADDETYSPLLFALQSPSLDRFGHYSSTGIHLYHLQIYPFRLEPSGDFRQPHFAFIDQHIRHLLRVDPEARVLVEMDLRDSKAWSDAHPDDRLITAQGQPQNASFASAAYAADVSHFVRSLVRFLNAQPYAERVIGYLPEIAEPESAMGGANQNAFQSDRTKLNIGDYNPQAIAMFQRFLRSKYAGSVERLRQAWRNPNITFDTARPRLEELVREGPGGGVFTDPMQGRLRYDYFEFLSTMVPTFVLNNVAKVIKEEAPDHRALVGFYYGYTVETMRSANNPGALLQGNHFFFNKVIDSPDIDFFVSPLQYEHRMAGDRFFPFQPYASIRLHNKLYIAELDLRTYVSGLTSYGRQRSETETVAVLKNDLGTSLIGGTGAWFADWSSGAGHSRTAVPFFDTPAQLDTIAQMKRLYDQSLDVPRKSVTQIAVFVSDKTQYYHDVAYASPLYKNLISRMLYDEMPYLGAPFDIYMMEDVEQPFVQDQYKLYVFLNPFYMSASQRAAVERLKRQGKTLLFFYAPGYVSNERGLQVNDIAAVTGVRVAAAMDKRVLSCTTLGLQHPLLEGISPGTAYVAEGFDYAPETAKLHPTALAPWFTITDPDAAVLATYPEGGGAWAARDFGGWKSVYSAVPFLDTAALRNIARWAGVHLYTEPGVVVEACDAFLLVHSGVGPTRKLNIQLPEARDVRNVFTGDLLGRQVDHFELNMLPCDTVMFRLSPTAGEKAATQPEKK